MVPCLVLLLHLVKILVNNLAYLGDVGDDKVIVEKFRDSLSLPPPLLPLAEASPLAQQILDPVHSHARFGVELHVVGGK